MQVHDIGPILARMDPLCRSRAKEREVVGIARERA